MSELNILITNMCFIALHDLSSGPALWNVYLSSGAKPVLKGGPFPDGNPNSKPVFEGLTFEQAELVSKRLKEFFSDLGIPCEVEDITDA